MFFAQFIHEIFGMRKAKPEPVNRRPIVARKDIQCTAGNGLTYQDRVQPQHGPRHVVVIDSLERQQAILWEGALKQDTREGNQALIEQVHGIPPGPPSPRLLLNPTQTLAVKYAAPKVPVLYTEFHQIWRHVRCLGEGSDGIVYQYQQRKRKNEFIAVKVPQSSSARMDLRREIQHLRRIGPHENILAFKHDSPDWMPYGPALFVEYCQMGD